MLNTAQSTVYRAFGLTVSSEIPLPELVVAGEEDTQADVVIQIDASQSASLYAELKAQNRQLIVKDGKVIFHIPHLALFSIEDGRTITVHPLTEIFQKEVRLYLLGTCMGSVLLQRKILPMHGSAILMNGKAYAFVGLSGAGKSTLAAALISKGYPLLSDDVIAITPDGEDGGPVVTPSYPQQKLWQNSLTQLKMDNQDYHPLYEIDTAVKYSVPVSSDYCSRIVPLGGVFELQKTDEETVSLKRCTTLEAVQIFRGHTFRDFLLPMLDLDAWHFSQSTSIIHHIDVYRLQRPASLLTIDQLAQLIIETVDEGGQTS
ncbi:hypothetical protein [Gorillibacterium massiliense]|uniref:hypothetical protein n=1 Tax=Gorillibacterium massiliense TaxID=1280390 RepID=UPI0004BB92B1|nr:hypothetical protein [Gorillibacterium massiliense]